MKDMTDMKAMVDFTMTDIEPPLSCIYIILKRLVSGMPNINGD
jgi:hypothetical protein